MSTREAALAQYREAIPAIVSRGVTWTFEAAARAPGAGPLSFEDVLLVFTETMRSELAAIEEALWRAMPRQ